MKKRVVHSAECALDEDARDELLTKSDRYSSFMLRFRWIENDVSPTWIISMQNTRSGKQLYFSSLNGLIQFLKDELAIGDEPDSDSRKVVQDDEKP